MTTRFRDRLADALFEQELDEAFAHGIKEGIRNNTNIMVFTLETTKKKMSKARREGFDEAIRIIREVEREYNGR